MIQLLIIDYWLLIIDNYWLLIIILLLLIIINYWFNYYSIIDSIDSIESTIDQLTIDTPT